MKKYVITYSMEYDGKVRNFMLVEEGVLIDIWSDICSINKKSPYYTNPSIINIFNIEDDLEWARWKEIHK